MITIPDQQTKRWQQANNSDLLGNVAQTKNITFDLMGYLTLSGSPRAIMDESIDTDFNKPVVILFSSDYGYFVETPESAFQVNQNILTARPTEIVTAGVPVGDIQSDAIWFLGLMVVTQGVDVKFYDPVANTWTDTNITLASTSGGQHPMANFLSLPALAVADLNTIKLYSTMSATPTVYGSTLTILSDFYITGMCYFNQNLYIGTRHIYGGHAFMYVWNGTGTAVQSAYEVDSNIIFSICVHKDSVVCFTGNGSLLRFNGAGFDLLTAFPIYYTDQALTDETNIGMYKNVMKSNGDLLYILFENQENDASRLLNQPDGLWCYDPDVGLYHRYSLSNALVMPETVLAASVNTTTNQITVANSYATGTEVYYRDAAGTSIPELVNNTKYFVIRVNATHVQLAATRTLALAGTPIDLTGTGNDSQSFIFFPNTDYGQFFTNRAFSINVIERAVATRQFGTDLLWGADTRRRTDSSAGIATLGTISDGAEARGYFITPKIFASNASEAWSIFGIKFSRFTSDIDKIIIKYRTYDDMKKFLDISSISKGTITWTSTTTFTVTDTEWANAVVGNEVEVLRGGGAGILAHITTITGTSTLTVTIDEAYADYVTGDIGRAVFRNWIKLKVISYPTTKGYETITLGRQVVGKFIQFKIELRGVGVRIEEISVDSVPVILNRNKE